MYDRKLIEYIPHIIRGVREYKAIMNDAEQAEMVVSWQAIDDALKDQFIVTATKNGIQRWEHILGITPKASESLDMRRNRILIRLNERLPYTMRMLLQWMTVICGSQYFLVELNPAEYLLKVRVRQDSGADTWEIFRYLHKIIPANLILDYQVYQAVEVQEGYVYTGAAANYGLDILVYPWDGSNVPPKEEIISGTLYMGACATAAVKLILSTEETNG